jgi:acyl-coenzyme A thioesterase PaaI-like protein
MNLWPPYLFSGIHIRRISPGLDHIEVELRDRFLNRNYHGTHFGGSLYAMTDPFYVLMITWNIGDGFMVWDKSARIEFLRPGKKTVRAVFDLDRELVHRLREEALESGRARTELPVEVVDGSGEIVARITKDIVVHYRGER